MDIDIKNIKLDKYVLEKINYSNNRHIKFLSRLNTYDVEKQYLYDITKDIKKSNNYIIKRLNNYIGYISISDRYNDTRALSIAIKENKRNKGIASNVTISLTDYLFENNFTNKIELIIDNDNKASIKCARNCNYSRDFHGNEVSRFVKVKGRR